MISSKQHGQDVTGIGTSLPVAMVQMRLYVIAKPSNQQQKSKRLLMDSCDFFDLGEATVKYAEHSGNDLRIDPVNYSRRFTSIGLTR